MLCGAPVIGIAAKILGSSLVVNSGHVARPRNLTVSVEPRQEHSSAPTVIWSQQAGGAEPGAVTTGGEVTAASCNSQAITGSCPAHVLQLGPQWQPPPGAGWPPGPAPAARTAAATSY